MFLKSPTDRTITVGLTSGHAISIPPGGREVPEQFIKAAINDGCLPADGTQVEAKVPASTDKSRMDLLVDGYKKYLELGIQMTGNDRPNRQKLGDIVGFQVTAVELEKAHAILKAEIAVGDQQ